MTWSPGEKLKEEKNVDSSFSALLFNETEGSALGDGPREETPKVVRRPRRRSRAIDGAQTPVIKKEDDLGEGKVKPISLTRSYIIGHLSVEKTENLAKSSEDILKEKKEKVPSELPLPSEQAKSVEPKIAPTQTTPEVAPEFDIRCTFPDCTRKFNNAGEVLTHISLDHLPGMEMRVA